MSKLSDEVFLAIKEALPFYRIVKEYYVIYKGQKLFFDFFIPDLMIAIEAQGQQHDRYVEHFHKDEFGFYKHKHRDKRKKQWAEDNLIKLLEIRPSDLPIDGNKLLSLIGSV